MLFSYCLMRFFFFKQKTAYEMRISDWSSDVCSSDLPFHAIGQDHLLHLARGRIFVADQQVLRHLLRDGGAAAGALARPDLGRIVEHRADRSEEHTSELQSLMRISYAVFCLKKKNKINHNSHINIDT